MADPDEERLGGGWDKKAQIFIELFATTEGRMKRGSGKFAKNRKRAESDWEEFAEALTDDFFQTIKDSGKAATMIDNPPKVFMRKNGWVSDQPPIKDVNDLFRRGIRRVRNNLAHGDKYVPHEANWERDSILIGEATYVLQEALKKLPDL